MTYPATTTSPDPARHPLRWLFLDLNSYFASVEQQLRPELRGRPVVVSPAESEYTSAIAASQEAKAHGIKTGTMIAEARAKCPGLVVVQARHDVYVRFHHRIVEEVWNHIPVTKVCSVDEMGCALMGRERLAENAVQIAGRIKDGLRRNVGDVLTCSIGLAPSRMLAKVAADMQKPDGLTILQSHDLPGKIADLKLSDFPGIGWNMVRRLAGRGIGDVADLWAMTARQMRQAWGSVEGERFWHALHGFDVPDPPTRKSSIGHSHVLAKPMRDPQAARLVARRLLLKAATRLRRMDYAAGALILHATFESHQPADPWSRGKWRDAESWSQEVRFQPSQDTAFFLSRVDELWERLLRDHAGRRLQVVGVVLQGLCPADAVVRDLFAPEEPGVGEAGRGVKLFGAVDSLNRKFGQDTVALGVLPGRIAKYVGAKIAFNRIPDLAEFDE